MNHGRFHAYVSKQETMESTPIPLRERKHQIIHIDSRNVTQNHNEYKVHLITPIQHIVKVELVNADIPMVVPNVSSKNNTFSFEEYVQDSSGVMTIRTVSISIPVGHYEEIDLTSEVQRLMNQKSTMQGGYTVTFLPHLGKTHITNINSSISDVRILDSGIGRMLGFSMPQRFTEDAPDVDASDDMFKYSAVSDNYIQMNQNPYLYLWIDECNDSYTDMSYDNENIEGKPFFGKLHTPVPVGTYFTYDMRRNYPVFREFYPQPLAKLDTLTIQWLDTNFDKVDFRGLPHNLSLMITTMEPLMA